MKTYVKKPTIVISISFIVIAAILGLTCILINTYYTHTQDVKTEQNNKINLTGTITCLPKKGNGPHTLECAIGILADNGGHYALKLDDQKLMNNESYQTGKKVRITGILQAPANNNSYAIVGVISVLTIVPAR